jgi:hypothetical protein
MHPQYGWSRQQPAAASAPPSLDPYADQRYDANTYATHAHDARTTAGCAAAPAAPAAAPAALLAALRADGVILSLAVD